MPETHRADEERAERPDRGRRRALRLLGAAAAGAAAQSVLGVGCAGERPPPALEVPLDRLPVGERVRLLHGEDPVELIRSNEGVEARSLWCTHYGCEVAWSPAEERYLCPCHEGVFDAEGRVLSGPPPRPLRRLAVQVVDQKVVVDLAAR